MTKQEFLAMSLPFSLKMCLTMNLDDDFYCDDYFDTELLQKGTIWDLSGIYNGDSYISVGDAELCDLVLEKNGTWVTLLLGDAKPILRPLSDLTKEIEHKGEKFVPIMRIYGGEDYFKYDYTLEIINRPILGDRIHIAVKDVGEINFGLKHPLNNLLTFHNYKQLIEWHFDVTGLIEKGEAIDVNTLQENPYK